MCAPFRLLALGPTLASARTWSRLVASIPPRSPALLGRAQQPELGHRCLARTFTGAAAGLPHGGRGLAGHVGALAHLRQAGPAVVAGLLTTGLAERIVGGGLLGPAALQIRCAGRAGGYKRKKKAMRPRTVHQKGLGKRMEFYWPRDQHRTRVPLYENSRQHVIWDHRMRKWMVMWYRHGMQVFRAFGGRGRKFEQGRMQAILFFKHLQMAGKLGRPKPDQCRSGVRGVFFDKEERAWVARWSDCGLKKYAVYGTQEMGFSEAYREAVNTRVQALRQNHQFMFQRTRWKGQRRPLGTPHT